jgi:hypothetical protein
MLNSSRSKLLYSIYLQVSCKNKPFDYMLFTPLYGVRNTGCPQISPKNIPQSEEKNYFFLNFKRQLTSPEAFSAPQNAQFCSKMT